MSKSFLGVELPHLPEKIEPVRSLGWEKLTESEKIIADSISVVEQRSILAVDLARASLAIIIMLGKIVGIVILILLLMEGPRIHRLWAEYLGTPSAMRDE